MHHLLVAAAFAFILVTPYMQAFPERDEDTIQTPDTLDATEDVDEDL